MVNFSKDPLSIEPDVPKGWWDTRARDSVREHPNFRIASSERSKLRSKYTDSYHANMFWRRMNVSKMRQSINEEAYRAAIHSVETGPTSIITYVRLLKLPRIAGAVLIASPFVPYLFPGILSHRKEIKQDVQQFAECLNDEGWVLLAGKTPKSGEQRTEFPPSALSKITSYQCEGPFQETRRCKELGSVGSFPQWISPKNLYYQRDLSLKDLESLSTKCHLQNPRNQSRSSRIGKDEQMIFETHKKASSS